MGNRAQKIFSFAYIRPLLYVGVFFLAGFVFFGNVNRAQAAVRTWTGTTSSSWSDASNWGGTAPATGDDLVFPAGASNLSSVNDLTENTIFNSITLSGSGYNLSGNPLILGQGLAGITDSASSGGNTISLDMRLDVTRDIFVTNTSEVLTISGRIGGVGGINKEGTGKLVLSGANTYGGVTKINVGTLNAQNATALGSIALGTEVVGGSALELQGGVNIGYEPLALRGYGVAGGGALRNVSDSNTFGGLITMIAGGAEIYSDAGTLTITGGMAGAFPLLIDGAGNITYSTTPIGTAAGTVTKNGSGTLTYNFPNTYTGLTTVNAGTLLYGTHNAILSGAVTVTAGTLNISSYSDMVGTVTLGTLDGQSGTITGTSGVLSSAAFTVYAGNISAVLGGPGGTLTKSSTGTVTLTRANLFTGAVSVSAGILSIQNSLALGTVDGVTTVTSGATLVIDGNGMSIPEFISISGTGLINAGAIENQNGNNTITGLITQTAASTIESDAGATLTISNGGVTGAFGLTVDGDGDTIFDTGPIAIGAGTLTKNGPGTLTLNTFNPYTGSTTVNHGVLTLSGNGSIIQSTVMQINTDGAINIDNTTGQLDRLSDSLALTLAGGDFNLYGSSTGSVMSIVGALTVSAGQNKINFYPGSGGSTVLRFASIARTAGASLLVRGANLGSTPGAGVSTLMFKTAPTLVGDNGNPGTPTVSILQGVFGDNDTSGDGTDMVTYESGANNNGLRLLNHAGFSNEYTTDMSVTNANVRLSSSIPATTTQINSLILDTGASITDPGSPQTITFVSGNIINHASGAVIAGANTTLAGGTSEFIMRMVGDIDVSANITTSGGLTKSGAGNMTFSSAKSYTGATRINRGKLTIGVSNAIPSTSAVTVDSSTLDIGNFDNAVGAVTLQGGTITGGTGVLTGTSYSLRDGTISAIIGGSGTVTKINTNTNLEATVILTRNNVYTGATTVTSGILQLGAAGDGTYGPLGTTAGGVTIANGATLDMNGFTLNPAQSLTMRGTGVGGRGALINTSNTPAAWNGDIVLNNTGRIGANFGKITIGGGISGAFALTVGGFSDIDITGVISTITTVTKDGFGTYTPSNSNSYTGTTTISAGTLKLGGTGDATNSPLGTVAGITTIAAGARFDLNGYTLAAAEPLTINGVGYGLGDFASGVLMNSSASAVTYSGLITLGSASTIKADFGDINLTNSGTITGAALALTLGGTGNGTLSSIIGTTTGTVTKIGTGSWTLSGASTFTGATSVNVGTLIIGSAGSGTNTPLGVVSGATSVLSGAVLDLNGFTLTAAEPLTLNGRGINGGGALINNSSSATGYSGAITQATDSRITNSGSGLLTLTGGVTGAFSLYVGGGGDTTFSTGVLAMGAGTFSKDGAGTVTNNSSATYTGATRVYSGTFAYGASGLLAATPVTILGGTWDMGGVADTVGTVTLVGGTIQNGTLTSTGYTLESGTISAVLAGAVAVAKNTNNTVTLTGANTISSTTAINGGTLVLSGNGTAVSTTITINLGATLTLDNSTTNVADRLGNALVLTMNGGNFNFIGKDSTTVTETIGQLAFASGHNIVTIDPKAGSGGSGTTLTVANNPGFNRTAGATVLFRGLNFGSTPAAGVSSLIFSTTPTLTGAGGSANSKTISVIKGAFGDNSLTGTGSDMVTYNVGNTNGLRLLNGAGFSGEYAGDLATSNANVKLTADRTAVATNTNSLILNGFNITNPGSGVTLPVASASLSGNVLINSANNIAGANTTLGITTFELDVLATASSTISAVIGTATTGSLSLNGPGNITLSAANLYTGTTYVNNATLTYGVNNAISSGGVTIVGGTYNLAGNSDTVGALTVNAGAITTGAGTLTTSTGALTTIANNNVSTLITGKLALGAGGTFNIGDGLMDNDVIISAVISGSFALTKSTGAGVLELSGNNTYTGLTTVSAGTLRLGATGDSTNTPLGTTAAGTTISGASSALDLNGYTLATSEALTLSGALATGALQNNSSVAASYSGLITLGAASTIISNYGDINITNTGNITGNTFALTIGGAGNGTLASNLNTTTGTLTKNGLGTWTISGSGSYTGLTTISAGTLRLGAAGDGTNTPLGTTGGATTITSGAMLDLNGYTLSTTESLTVNGTGIASTGSLINNSSSATSYNGAITLGAASRIANYGSGVLTLAGAISGNFALTTVTMGDIAQSSASVWSGTGTLVKEGSGTLVLAGQNSMTGAMTVSTGVLQVGANGGATNTPLGTIAGGVTVSAGAVLDLSNYVVGGASTWEPLTLNGTGIANGGALISSAGSDNNFGAMTVSTNSLITNNGSGTINITGTVTIANAINLGVGGSGPTTISGSFGASATSATLTKWDSGTLILSGSSTTTGLTRINGGTLQYGTSNAINTGAVTVAGGILDINGNTDSVGAITIQNGGTITDSNGTPGVLTGTAYTFYGGGISGVLGGTAIAMTKSTGDSLTLSKTFANTGTLTINAGTVQYLASNIINDSAAVTVAGGTLDIQSYTDTLGTLTLTSGFIIGSGTFTGSSYAVASGTITANLAGAVNLTKTTTGTVTLAGTNTYSGITTISGGTLSVSTIGNGGVAGNLGQASNAAGNIVFNTAVGTLQYTGGSASTDRSYTTTNAIAATFDITNPGTVLTWGGAGTVTTAPITKSGPGTLVFTSAQGHTGLTTVSGGTLQYGVANMLSTGAVTVVNGVLDLNNISDSVGIITLQTDGQIIDSGGTTAVLTTTGTAALQSGLVSARLGGSVAAGISKTTGGRVTLSADNTFTSTSIALSAGYLNLQNSNALGASGTTLTTTITSGAVMELQGNITLPSTKLITANGTGVNNVGAIRNISDTNAIQATLTLGSSGVRVNSDSGSLTIPSVSGNARSLIVGGAGDTTITGAIATTSGTLTKDGAGTLTLSGANTFTGSLTLSGGTIVANATAALGSGGVNNTLIFNGGTLQASGNITSPVNRAVTLTQTAIIDTNGNDVSFAGTVGSAAGLTKLGSGTLTLTGVTTLGGELTISNGTFVAPANLTVTGNLSNSGTFTHNNGSVTIIPNSTTGVASVGGSSDTTFYDFADTTDNSILTFKAGKTYTFANSITVTGTSGRPIALSSDTPGQQWLMDLSGTASFSYLSVQDSGCSGVFTITNDGTLVNIGNNGSCWGFVSYGGGGGPTGGGSGSSGNSSGGGSSDGNGGICGNSAIAIAILTGDHVTSVTMVCGGSSYGIAPVVNFIDGGGTGAAAVAVLTGDVITAINVTNGGMNYTSAPTVTFGGVSGGGGGSGGGGSASP